MNSDVPIELNRQQVTKPINVNFKKLTFYTIFFLAFLVSGSITILHIIPYRMGVASLLILPLIFLYGLKINKVVICYGILVGIITVSAIYNHSSPIEYVLFLRTLAFSFLIYYLVDIYVSKENIVKIVRLCIGIAIIQLPIVLLQQTLYNKLPARITQGIIPIDFDFGTFNANDAPLSIFLALIVIFLLFDKKRSYIIRHKFPIVLWLTLTIFIINAELVKIIIAVVWGIYLIRYLNPKILISTVVLFLIILGALAASGLLNEIWTDFSYSFSVNASTDPIRQDAFLSGNYSRGGAVAYYLNNEIKWLGDGPSKYYDVLTKTRALGNTGHIFTFYSEVGLFGMLLSYLIFFFIAFPVHGWRIRITLVGLLSFIALLLLSFTTEIMNDISIFLIFCLINKTYLIPLENTDEPAIGNQQ